MSLVKCYFRTIVTLEVIIKNNLLFILIKLIVTADEQFKFDAGLICNPVASILSHFFFIFQKSGSITVL